jgi:biotin-(acetyl-CoA carboxylase) ligase
VRDDLSEPRRLLLPPPYTAHWLAQGDAFTQACALAPDHGAGTLVWHTRHGGGAAGRLDFAVVLEPDSPLTQARSAFILCMLALGDAVAAHCPPERGVTFGWPSELLLDAGRLGGARLAVAPETGEDDVPDWIVFGVELIADRDHLTAPGSKPGSVSLKEEEFEDPAAIVESFAAYLMLNFDRLNHGGMAPLAARYSAQLGAGGTVDEAGDLKDAQPLAAALSQSPWRDGEGPKL